MSHAIVRGEDDTTLLHSCAGPCAEGDYLDREGFGQFEMWPPGRYGVSYYVVYYGDEQDDGLQLTYDDIPDADYYPQYDDPQPKTGVVRGFPYSGGKWTA